MGFPIAAQAGLLTRQHAGRKDEMAGLITDLPPEALDAAHWLNRTNSVQPRMDTNPHE